MADVTIGARLQLDGKDAENSVKSIKAQLREAQTEVVKLSEKFGSTSKEAMQAAKRAAELKDAIGDSKSLIDAFNPDQKFRALSQSLGGVLGGFTALTGAMGLLGVESEDTQKMLLKVQSAMALSQGLNQVGDAIQSFKNLGAMIQATSVFQKANNVVTTMAVAIQKAFGVSVVGTGTAFNVLKGAIAASGIGLLVVGLAAAADALGVFSSSSDDAADAQSKLNDEIEKVNSSLGAQTRFYNRRAKEELAAAKAAGKTTKEIFAIEQKYRELDIDAKTEHYNKLAGLDEQAAAKALADLKDAQSEKRIAELNYQASLRKPRSSGTGTKKTQAETPEDEAKYLKIARDYEMEKFKQEIEVKKIENGELAALDNERFMQSSALAEAQNRLAWNTAEINAQAAEMEADRKIRSAQLVGNILGSLADLVGKQTVAGKALAIAQATIDTYAAGAAILKNTARTPAGGLPGYAIAQMIAVIAAGLVQVRNIVKTKVPGFSAGGGGGVSSVSAVAPITPQLPNATRTTLDQQQLNQIGNATVRAYVTEYDITNSQERVRRLNRAARL